MPTKAQEFRSAQQRAARPPKPKKPKKRRRDAVVDTSQPGTSATDRKVERRRTRSILAGNRGGAVTEDPVSSSTRPSRKSTRKSADHTKRSTNQQLEAVRKSTSPTATATRARAARPVRGRGGGGTPR
ncbi:MAG TPA: hypothetical protein VM261_00120 [Kofleriaceae bacterium]|nr:hypothetical protein [Kofleriaceae bacterium]